MATSPAPSVLAAYVAGEARAFFPDHFRDPAARARITARAARPLAPEVARALRAQNAAYAPSEARDANLARLERGAAAVVTGQQVGLFLGPLYTLYKAASAIAISRALERESGVPVAPVFWLQTEDHDLPEVASCAVPRDGQPPLVLAVPASSEARVSLAHCVLPGEVGACTAALRAELERLPHAAEHLARVERAYRPGARWGEAFGRLLAELFAPEGLIVIDPRDARLAAQTRAVHERALREADAIAALLLERAAALRAAGFEPQVHVRAGAPLCFFHAPGSDGDRRRLLACERGFREAARGEGAPEHAREHGLAELLDALGRDPLRFSTSALLRPIVQDTLLPTAAYVGGPGEIAYFAQLSPLYAAFDVAMPLIVPRARFRVIEAKIGRALERLGLTADEALRDPEELAAALAERTAAVTPAQLEAELRARFDAALDGALERLGALAEALEPARDKTRAAVHAAAGKLAEKHKAALARQNDAARRDIERVQLALAPLGEPQERVHGFSYYAARYGERAFAENVLRALETTDVFDPNLRDLRP